MGDLEERRVAWKREGWLKREKDGLKERRVA
jgi:hypothetical protein